MNLIVDESVDARIVEQLRHAGHDVLAIAESAAGATDEWVLAQANTKGVLLLTADKDFGELVYRRRLAHCGVVLLRQMGLSITARADAVLAVLESHAAELAVAFTVIATDSVRIRGQIHPDADRQAESG